MHRYQIRKHRSSSHFSNYLNIYIVKVACRICSAQADATLKHYHSNKLFADTVQVRLSTMSTDDRYYII